MELRDALSTGELSKGAVIAGNEGLSREVVSIEVMEVPEVVTWVTPGILVMTAFYSIKDNVGKQIEIVQSLIDIGAAGIVIKIGRFIDSIPDGMIELANQNEFPIIVIPKDISYINVIRPLFEKLYDEKRTEVEKGNNPFYEIQKTNFSSLIDALEAISKVVESVVYVEDLEGKLLYVTKDFRRDGWRESSALFSAPTESAVRKVLEGQKDDLHKKNYLNVDIQGFRNRLLLPLTSQNKVFAIAHIPYKDKLKFKDIPNNYMKILSDQLSELFLNDQLFLQKKRLQDMELINKYAQQPIANDKSQSIAIVCFHTDWMENLDLPPSVLIDYSSIARGKLYGICNQLSNCESFIFEKNNYYYGLIIYKNQGYSDMVRQWENIIANYDEKNQSSLSIAISSPLYNGTSFDNIVNSVAKMMEVGLKIKPEEKIYTYDQLGIYDILLNLTANESVVAYVNNILKPLEDNQGDLIKTLEIYLDENGNISKTSERLYVHRRTLTYRLRKMEELLYMDLNDSSNRFILNFCLKIKDLF